MEKEKKQLGVAFIVVLVAIVMCMDCVIFDLV